MECFPRKVDVSDPNTKQYPGWPKTIHQRDNYGRVAKAYLPTLVVKGKQNPVVKIIRERDGEWIYALRINGTRFKPKVFEEGHYTIEVGEGDNKKIIRHVESIGLEGDQQLTVDF